MDKMNMMTSSAVEILDRMVAFETISSQPNLDFVDYVKEHLMREGIEAHISYDETGQRANIHGLIGPKIDGGVVLNGHTDVVPVEGQDWTSHPFHLTARDGRLHGRGAVDMKGFLACMLAAVPMWKEKALKRPIHISMCYDEENGGFGAPVLVKDIAAKVPRPAVAVVGEPTGMRIISGHKGGYEMRTEFTGLEAHSSDPRKGASAILYATRFINQLERIVEKLRHETGSQSPFDPPHTTVNIGMINGGTARNIVPGHCAIEWECRPSSPEDGKRLMAEIHDYADNELLGEMRQEFSEAQIDIITEADVPGLNPEKAAKAVAFLSEVTGLNSTDVVSFGTDAGHFCKDGISTVVFGPGSIDQAHKPDEYIEISQLTACMKFFDKLGNHMTK